MNHEYLRRRLQGAIKRASTLRVLFVFPLALFLLARHYINLRVRPERRVMGPHIQIGDRRRTWFQKLEDALGIEPPSSTRDLRVNIVVIVATIQVTLIILATARVQPEALLLIPAFCLYAAMILAFRKYRIQSSNLAS